MKGTVPRVAGKMALLFAGLLAAGLLLEAVCQGLYAFVVAPPLAARRKDPLHYCEASGDPVLVYGLKSDCRIVKAGRVVRINRHGLRDDRRDLDASPGVALLGDSVTFGIGLSQDETAAAVLQRLSGAEESVVNFSVPGYGLLELRRELERMLGLCRPDRICYVLNLNDFSVRDTVFEGGDNGLYRMYAPPVLKAPFFVRKAIYRFMKGGGMSSVRWCRWLYEGNRATLLPVIREMAEQARSRGCEFDVVLFPPAAAYTDEGFVLQDVVGQITAYLRDHGIPVVAPVAEFGADVRGLQDGTDHLTAAGSECLARVIREGGASR
jgi:hypothetical protein